VFLVLSLFYTTYIISGFLVHPDWRVVARAAVTPTPQLDPGYLVLLIALVGTTITPWGQFFIQAYVVDKGITPEEYPYTRMDVSVGAVVTNVVSLFIILATAGALYTRGIRIEDAADAALALEPLAGRFASAIFAVGLLNASLLAASIVPLSSAYAVCEAFGWEAGVNTSFREAPAFNGLYTFTVGFGALVAQTINGILLPAILVFSIRLAATPRIMGPYANGPVLNLVAWATAAATIVATILLLLATFLLPLLG